MTAASDKLASLDGLRAVSIVLVVMEHLHRTNGFPQGGFDNFAGDYGRLGVTIFFVISGFLITTLLLREEDKAGRVSLWRFYARRALRIIPAFLMFMFAIVAAERLGWVQLNPGDLTASFTYTVNYKPDRSWDIGHLWSLSVEEQFYLLWPFTLVMLGRRKGAIAALALFALAPLVRLYMRFQHPDIEDLEIFPAVADAIAIGCLMAILRPWLLAQQWYLRITQPWILVVAIVVTLLVGRNLGYAAVDLFGEPIKEILLGIVVEASTRWTTNGVGRFLNARPVVYLGLLSYSLYLWQQPFMNRHETALACSFPVNLLLAVACAMLSYHLLEKPLLGLRHRLSVA